MKESEKEPERREQCRTCECYKEKIPCERGSEFSIGECRAGPPVDDYRWPKVAGSDWCLEWGRKR